MGLFNLSQKPKPARRGIIDMYTGKPENKFTVTFREIESAGHRTRIAVESITPDSFKNIAVPEWVTTTNITWINENSTTALIPRVSDDPSFKAAEELYRWKLAGEHGDLVHIVERLCLPAEHHLEWDTHDMAEAIRSLLDDES